MLRSSTPPSFPIAFASGAGGGFIRAIPQASQIGISNGAASLTDGFPPLNFQPVAAGGVPPFGEDFNGILNQITLWNQWQEAGGPVSYNSAFSASIGGYPQCAILQSVVTLGKRWMSTVDNNTTNPDSSGAANWVTAPGDVATGTPVQSLSSTLPSGYVAANGLSIGDAGSSANGRANPDTIFLFTYNWLTFPNSACQLFNAAGSPVARGANPAADFAAKCSIATPNMKGLGLMGVDTMGGAASTFLSGVPVTSGSTTTPGSVVGENMHTLTMGESANFTPSGSVAVTNGAISSVAVGSGILGGAGTLVGSGTSAQVALQNGGSILISSTQGGSPASFSGNNVGGGGAHNTTHRSMTVYWGQKL